MCNSCCWWEKIITAIKHKGLDYGIQTRSETQGCCTPWAGSFSLRKNIIARPRLFKSKYKKDYSSEDCMRGFESKRFKIHLNVSSFLIGKHRSARILLRVVSNPRNRDCDGGTSQSIPDNPVRDLLTQGLPLSPASHPPLGCHLLLFQLESVNLDHITPKVRLWSPSHHRKTQLALKANSSPAWGGKQEQI